MRRANFPFESVDFSRAAMATALLNILCLRPAGLACATPVDYTIDPDHTHPAFEVDHYGMSMWRGMFRHTSGTVMLDAAAASGSVDVTTLHGITRPVALTIPKFRCLPDRPVLHREVCGADAIGTFNRADFGITVGQRYGFDMEVTLRIQVEASKNPPQSAGP
jgi:polyisoprenoid-binding protein YceI